MANDIKNSSNIFRTFIDDINQSHYHGKVTWLVREATQAGQELAQFLVGSSLIISSKSVVISNSLEAAREVSAFFRRRDIRITIAPWAKDLGVGNTAGKGRHGACIQNRIASIKGRSWRIKRLHRTNKRAGKLLQLHCSNYFPS